MGSGDGRAAWRGALRWAVLVRTGKSFIADELPDRAAALTYYAMLSIFPALLVLVSVVGLVSAKEGNQVLLDVQQLAPPGARHGVHTALLQLRTSGAGGAVVGLGLAASLWSSSSYIGGFIRAADRVYGKGVRRPLWKTLPLRLGLTVLLMLLIAASTTIVVFTGSAADRAGRVLHIGPVGLTVWSVAKWPALVVLLGLLIAVLYWAAPGGRKARFRWITPGSALAVGLWLLASGGLLWYVSDYGHYNRTYGALAGVIIFLIWLWVSNLAVLLGMELDAELSRTHAPATPAVVAPVPGQGPAALEQASAPSSAAGARRADSGRGAFRRRGRKADEAGKADRAGGVTV